LIYAEQPPPPSLAPYVECLWSVCDPRPRAQRAAERVVPDGCPELILHLGDPFARQVDGTWRVQPRAFLAGTLTRPWMLRPGRRVRSLSVRFRPGGAAALFRVSLEGTADREVPLAGFVDGGRALLDAVRAERTTARGLARLSSWLQERVPQAREMAVAPAVEAIRQARGQAPIDEVAHALGWTRRRLQRVFARELGIAPKVYARIVRLGAVLASLGIDERAAAVDLALDAGFFDQAHLLRDFRALAGRTPRAGRESDGPLARHFTDPVRLRALLAGD
jgi:methylphosphotriester-DNA--protein-cysteine methyltransferase